MAKQPQIQRRNASRLLVDSGKNTKLRSPRNGERHTRCTNCCVRLRFTDFDDPDTIIRKHLEKERCIKFDFKSPVFGKFRMYPAKVGSNG